MEINFDTNFWTVIIALASLIVSLYPSIRAKIQGPKLLIEPLDTISVSHKYGLTNAQWVLTLTNNGGTDIRIKKINIKLTRDGIPIDLPARNFYRNSESLSPNLFTTIKLKPSEDLTYNFGFFPVLDRKTERLIRELESKAKSETAIDFSSTTPKVLSPDTISKLTEIYNQNFFLKHGDYQIDLFITTTPPIKTPDCRFRFTIFEGDERDLKSLTHGYVTGHGVCMPLLGNIWFNIPLSNS